MPFAWGQAAAQPLQRDEDNDVGWGVGMVQQPAAMFVVWLAAGSAAEPVALLVGDGAFGQDGTYAEIVPRHSDAAVVMP